jgi:hypothetical protein
MFCEVKVKVDMCKITILSFQALPEKYQNCNFYLKMVKNGQTKLALAPRE